MKALTLFAWCVLLASNAIAQKDGEPMVLEIVGRITDGEKKLAGCQVTVYDGNDVVGEQVTDKSGRFGIGLGLQKEFAIVFQREGFLPKRMLVDTRAKIPVEVVAIAPLDMEMSMLVADKYEGADTDVLDFPFAIVKWNRQVGAFVQDQEYTVDMMRANGAALLQAGRSVKH
ncbi:MAG: hypothetical protein IPG92_03695 [Flavobacteriales bacterium]|nr:hypothetical protein [Flavobacteriales bacterium]